MRHAEAALRCAKTCGSGSGNGRSIARRDFLTVASVNAEPDTAMASNDSTEKSAWAAFLQAGRVVTSRLSRGVRVSASADGTLPRAPSFYVATVFACIVILLVMLLLDSDLALWAKSAPRGVRQFFLAITDLGTSGWILVVSGVGALVLAASNIPAAPRINKVRRANWHGDLCFVFATVAVTGILASLIKNTIGRARPRHMETYGPYEFDFAAFTSGFASFPSGHSTTFGAFCACLCLLVPRLTPLWIAFGVIGGLSRMMVGAHYASDVIAGLLFGSVLTILFARWLSRRNVLFTPHPEGRFVPMRKRLPFD